MRLKGLGETGLEMNVLLIRTRFVLAEIASDMLACLDSLILKAISGCILHAHHACVEHAEG